MDHHPDDADIDLDIEAVDPDSPVATLALRRYVGELADRFGFAPPTGADRDGRREFGPPGGVFLVARLGGRVVGCAGLRRLDDATAEVKRMWIDPGCRGRGLGRRLLAAVEDAARAAGRCRVVLDTNGALTEAIALYRRAGYAQIEQYNDNPDAQLWFAKRL